MHEELMEHPGHTPPHRDHLDEATAKLLPAAQILAASSYTGFLDDFPILKDVPVRDWDFFVTVAGVCVGLSTLVGRVPDDRFKSLYSLVSRGLLEWDRDAERAALDCREFIARSLSPISDPHARTPSPAHPAEALGVWILWNLVKRAPKNSELPLAGTLGRFVGSAFNDWWDRP